MWPIASSLHGGAVSKKGGNMDIFTKFNRKIYKTGRSIKGSG